MIDTDVRDAQKVATLPDDLKGIADKMLQEKFGLAHRGEVIETESEQDEDDDTWEKASEEIDLDEYPRRPGMREFEQEDRQYKFLDFVVKNFVSRFGHQWENSIQARRDYIEIRLVGVRSMAHIVITVPVHRLEGMSIGGCLNILEKEIMQNQYSNRKPVEPYGYYRQRYIDEKYEVAFDF